MSRQRRFARRHQQQDDFIDGEPYSPLTLRQPGDETDTDTVTTSGSEGTESEESALQPYSHDVHVARRRESWARVLNTLDAHGRFVRSTVHHATETGERALDAGRTVFEEVSFWIQVLCITFFRVLWLLLRDIAFPILQLSVCIATFYIIFHAIIGVLIHGCGNPANALEAETPVEFCQQFDHSAGGRLLDTQLIKLIGMNENVFKAVDGLHELEHRIAGNPGQLLTEMTVLSDFVKRHEEKLNGHRDLIVHAGSSQQYALHLRTMMKDFEDDLKLYRYDMDIKMRQILAGADRSEPFSAWQTLFSEALYKVFPRAFFYGDPGRLATEYARVAQHFLQPNSTAALTAKSDQINIQFGGIQRIAKEAHDSIQTMRAAWTSSCKSSSATAEPDLHSCYVNPDIVIRKVDAAMKRTESSVRIVKEQRAQLVDAGKHFTFLSERLGGLLEDASRADWEFKTWPRISDLLRFDILEKVTNGNMHPMLARAILYHFIERLRELERERRWKD